MRIFFNFFLLSFVLIIVPYTTPAFVQASVVGDEKNLVSYFSSEDLKRKISELKYYDEVLTSSVLTYAFSGEEKWLIRYYENESKLTKIIQSLLAIESISDKELLIELEKTNKALVALEIKVITATKNNDRKTAISIINSDEYLESKSTYMLTMTRLLSLLEARAVSNKTDNKKSLLTAEERYWVANNKVKIGIEHWPPILFMQDDNNPGGLVGEILRQIIEKTGLQVEYKMGTWSDILNQFKQEEIDLLPDAYFTEEREKYGNYTTPFFSVRELFYVKDSNTRFQKNIDLSEAVIAISSGYTTIDKIKSVYPNIRVIETAGIEESLDQVLSGEADALLDAQIVVDDWVEQNNINGVRVIDEDIVFPPSLHLLSNKRKKVLHSILQKGLDSIKASDLMNSNNDWLTSRNTSQNLIEDSFELNYLFWFVLGAITLLFIIGHLLSSLVLKGSEKELIDTFSSPSFKKMVVSSLTMLSVLLIVISYFTINYADKHRNESLEYSLSTLLTSIHQRLDVWIEHESSRLEQLGKNKELVSLVEKLLLVKRQPKTLQNTMLQSQVRQFFKEREGDLGNVGFFIISPDNISLASRRDSNVGLVNVIHNARPDLLQSAFNGESIFIPPIRSDVHIKDEYSIDNKVKPPTMFFVAPVINEQNQVIAAVTIRVDFEGIFSSILSTGFIGKSGETYAIDKFGHLLSNVRFENQLKEIGLINENDRSSLSIKITDPGKRLLNTAEKVVQDKDWPLTLMASHIAAGKSGSNLEGYRNYRGEIVVGSWIWDDNLNMGIVAEMDVEEALKLLQIFKYSIWSILFISLLLVFGGTLFTLKVGTRATMSLARSQLELEGLVGERTKALEANMKRTRSIIDTASDGIIVVNEQGLIQEFGPAAEVIFGYSASEVLQTNINKLLDYAFHQKFIESKEITGKEQRFFQLIGCKKNNELIDIEVAVGEAWLEDERIFTGILRNTTLRNIEERALKKAKLEAEKATQSLAKQAQMQQLLIDALPIPIFYKNAKGKFEGFNIAYEEVFGVKSSDLVGLTARDLTYLPAREREIYNIEDAEIISEQKHIKREVKILFADGKLHDTLYWVKGFTDNENKPAGLVGSFIDVTNEKENARQLEIALKSADKATKAKSEFLANMSHEIRTPMNAIIGMSYLAIQTNLSRKQADYVNKIKSSAEALLGIINDILDFSKIEAGKLEIEAIPFNLNDTFDHLVQTISHRSQEKSLELLIDLSPNLPLDLIGDSLRLGQILINLANNSIKFTDQGEIVIRARAIKQDEKNVTVEFSVCDTGIGMTEKQLTRLFQSFSQADASTTRKYGGTGLGLTISKTLTELMHGEIWVESISGEGSEFYFTATFGIAERRSDCMQVSPASLVHLPVLIVDDSQTAREILFKMSESLGFKPELAASGSEALDKLALAEQNNTPYKVVISDWKMPHMNGVELGEKIISQAGGSLAPKYIIVTAYDRDEMLKSAKHINLAGSLIKPICASTLFDTILTVMGESQSLASKMPDISLDRTIAEGIVGAKILLVEDNEINQQIAVELLEMAGLVVSVALNGKVAVEAVEHNLFDAVLMDIQMPVMDGYTATKIIRKDNKNIDLPIIAMTANAMAGDREKFLAAGMNDHIPKPINPQDVYKTLVQWIKPTGKVLGDARINKIEHDEDPFPILPEFEVNAALNRMSGNIKAYRDTLKKVAISEIDAVKRIKKAIVKKDYQTALLAAHTLKGIAATIGAAFVVSPAEKLELILSDKIDKGTSFDNEVLEMLFLECEVKLTQMVSAIDKDQRIISKTRTNPQFDRAAITQLLRDLKEQIDISDSAANETLKEIFTYVQVNDLSNDVRELANSLALYDFERAENLYKILEQEINKLVYLEGKAIIDDELLLSKFNLIMKKIESFDSTVVDSVDELLTYKLDVEVLQTLEKSRDALSQYDFDAGEKQLTLIKNHIMKVKK